MSYKNGAVPGLALAGHALIPALDAHMCRLRAEPGALQHSRQGHAGELPGAEDHGFLTPQRLLANPLKVLEIVGIAARALHDGAHGAGWESPQILIGDFQWTLSPRHQR